MTPHSAPDKGEMAQRRALRNRALHARQALAFAVREALTVQLAAHLDGLLDELRPRVLAFCWPYRAEPDLRACVSRWLASAPERIAALPVVQQKDAAMIFRRWIPGVDMPRDRHGIPHPTEGDSLTPDAVLVPLNAFDAQGYRLGYGGGYFDRTLANLPTLAIGVGFEIGRVDSVLPQAHDRPMAWIVTERGAMKAGAR